MSSPCTAAVQQALTIIVSSPESSRIEALRSGCNDAYRELVAEYGDRLLSAARRVVRDEDEARDCVQEGLLRAFRALDRFEGRSSLYSWLFRIVTNVALKRRSAAARLCSIDATLAVGVSPEAMEGLADRDGPEAALHRFRQAQRLRAAVEVLPERHRQIIQLRDFEGHDTAETAALLGITRGAAKVRLHRARVALRKVIQESDSSSPPGAEREIVTREGRQRRAEGQACASESGECSD